MNPASAEHARRRHGFTLIELFVVIAVVVVLTTLISAAARSALDVGRRAGCTSHLRQLGSAIMLYAGDHDGQLPFGPQASAFGMSGNLYTSTGAPTSLITLEDGRFVGLGLVFPYLKEPKCFFCPGNDQPVDTAQELAKLGRRQVQSSYYYRHAGNTNITDIGGAGFKAPRLGALGDNRRGIPISALVMDSQFLCAEGLRGFGAVSRTHHRAQFTNVLYADGRVVTLANHDNALNVDITNGANAYKSFDMILEKFEIADEGGVQPRRGGTRPSSSSVGIDPGGESGTPGNGVPIGKPIGTDEEDEPVGMPQR